jgi:hypothetical protein
MGTDKPVPNRPCFVLRPHDPTKKRIDTQNEVTLEKPDQLYGWALRERLRFVVRALTLKHLNRMFSLVSCRVYQSTKRKEKS